MKLNSEYALPSGLYYFRVIVQITVEEEIIEVDQDGDEMDPLQGYFQTFGVTASGLSDAIQVAEEMLAKHEPAGGSSDDPKGSIQMIEACLLDPESVELDEDEWKTERGVHFVSGRVLFAGEDAFEDEDPSGQQAIYQRVYDEITGESDED